MRILVVEDDPHIARDLCESLSAEGYLVEHEADGNEAWFLGDTEDYSAVILDLGLPGMDGLSLLRKWRENNRSFAILILTARGNWTERVEGINAGADDYLAKPFRMEELLARLNAVIRRSAGQSSPVRVFGELRIDTARKAVSLAGRPVSLTPLEYRCLLYLATHAGRIVSRMELTEQLYAQDFERESNSVEVLVGRLRRKLGADLIRTRRGFGYIIENGKA